MPLIHLVKCVFIEDWTFKYSVRVISFILFYYSFIYLGNSEFILSFNLIVNIILSKDTEKNIVAVQLIIYF